MQSEYHSPAIAKQLNRETGHKSEHAPRYRGVSYTTPINAAKEAVPVIDLADRLAGPAKLRRAGATFVTNCLVLGHEDRVPSFVVYPQSNSWYCHGCLEGGDVVELYRLAHGYDQREAHTAAAYLLMEFGHEVPQRPPAWWRKQERQRHTRDAVEEAKVRRVQRRLYRWLFAPKIARLEDKDERAEEARMAWEDCGQIARLMLAEFRQHGKVSA